MNGLGSGQPQAVVATGLFKPASDANCHEPLHRMVAEYAAGRELAQRIDDESDHLTAERALSLIAPNRVVREELKGLFAWMTAFASRTHQLRLVSIDPYAVLANGDPARLSEAAKSLLLERLATVVKDDPHFRGSDIWRTFSAVGFFTDATVGTVKALLLRKDKESHQLRQLLLELLPGSTAVLPLGECLRDMLHDDSESQDIRLGAAKVLLSLVDRDATDDVNQLLHHGSAGSALIAARLLMDGDRFGDDRHSLLLRLYQSFDATLFPLSDRRDRTDSRYIIETLTAKLVSNDVVYLLNGLSLNLRCNCGAAHAYACHCRDGKTHLIGLLLDRLFKLSEYQPSAERLWSWTKSLNFKHHRTGRDSAAVAALQSNHALRQEVQRLAFDGLETRDQISSMRMFFYSSECHSGLQMRAEDIRVIVDRAYEANRVDLWSQYMAYHRANQEIKGPDPLRARMRAQALAKPHFLRHWSLANHHYRQQFLDHQLFSPRRQAALRRRDRRNRLISTRNQAHFEQHREQIEDGRHFGWLRTFASGYLRGNTEHFPECEDTTLPVRALRNSFDFLRQHLPTLEEMARTQSHYYIIEVLHAACLAEYRATGALDHVNEDVLQAVKTTSATYYTSAQQDDREAFDTEVARCAFRSADGAESFVRRYIEPQIGNSERQAYGLHWLKEYPQFRSLLSQIPLEWLRRYPDTSLSTSRELFDLAAEFGDRPALLQLVDQRCAALTLPTNHLQQRDFWLERKFIFCDEVSPDVAAWLREDRERLMVMHQSLEDIRLRGRRGWPSLSAQKIAYLLNIFAPLWPPVRLPSTWGTGDPPEETAYRFLSDIVWSIPMDRPADAVRAIEGILVNDALTPFHTSAKAMRANARRELARTGYQAPSAQAVAEMLDEAKVATVEDLRAFLVEQLAAVEAWAHGGPTDYLSVFYDDKGEHVEENEATKRIVDRLELACRARNMGIDIERHMASGKRCDITAQKHLEGRSRLLVVEVKGQWHPDLYSAAKEQLHTRYSIHPDAEQQGIFLVLWFGPRVTVAGKKRHKLANAAELRQAIIESMPEELRSRIDVVVLDLAPRHQA